MSIINFWTTRYKINMQGRSAQERNYRSYERENAMEFKNIDVDLYSLLMVPRNATRKQIYS